MIETTEVALVAESEVFYKVRLHGVNSDNKIISTVCAEALTSKEIDQGGFVRPGKARDLLAGAMQDQGHPDWRKKFATVKRVLTTITRIKEYKDAV